MKKTEFIALLSNPEKISRHQTNQLDDVLESYPFFQTAQALRLKGLKEHKNFLYNKALKKTAAHTIDRGILFEWITSKSFLQNKVAKEINAQKIRTETPKTGKSLDDVLRMNLQEAGRVLDPHLFEATKTLELGKALEFDSNEEHSFSEWLKSTSAKPIVRKKENDKNIHAKTKKRKSTLVDTFISKNPKIVPSKKPIKESVKVGGEYFPNKLMTQTLARVYLEQRNFEKAIRAYKILILKNPEKSGFFADQIRAIEKLQENKSQ